MNSRTAIQIITLCLTLPLLSACFVSLSVQLQSGDTMIEPGSTLIIKKPIKIPAGDAEVWIQNGQTTREYVADQYNPYCRLEINKPHADGFKVLPGEFLITRIYTYTELVKGHHIRLATLGPISGTDPVDEIYKTVFELESDQQAEVSLLSCEHWEDASGFAEHLTLNQITTTLEGLMQFKPVAKTNKGK